VSLAATVAATVVAAILAALIARRDALIAIPVSSALWAIIGISVAAVGAHIRHPGLTDWGGSWSPPRVSEQPPACPLPPTAGRHASTGARSRRPPAIRSTPSPQDR
jgi:hypothetical protein